MMARDPLARDDINAVLAALGRRIGTQALALDDAGMAMLVIDGGIELTLVHFDTQPGLVASIPLDGVPVDDVALLKAMLRANMAWSLTGGGIITLDPGSGQPALCRLVALHDRDLDRIERELADLVELARVWRNTLMRAAEAVGKPAPPPQTPSRTIFRP